MKPLNKSDWINDPLVQRRLGKIWEVEGDYFKQHQYDFLIEYVKNNHIDKIRR